jgi:hypothetical protein
MLDRGSRQTIVLELCFASGLPQGFELQKQGSGRRKFYGDLLLSCAASLFCPIWLGELAPSP